MLHGLAADAATRSQAVQALAQLQTSLQQSHVDSQRIQRLVNERQQLLAQREQLQSRVGDLSRRLDAESRKADESIQALRSEAGERVRQQGAARPGGGPR